MIYRLNGIGFDSNTYFITGKKNILVDPGTPRTFKFLKEEIEKLADRIDYIINTHCHYDHCGSDHLFQEHFGAPVLINSLEIEHLKKGDNVTVASLFGDELIPPKEIIPINEVTEELNKLGIDVIETPGHTKGGITLAYEDNLITGDTLFAYGVGRYDLPTGNLAELRESVERLERLAFEKRINNILPGHGETGNLGAFANARLFL